MPNFSKNTWLKFSKKYMPNFSKRKKYIHLTTFLCRKVFKNFKRHKGRKRPLTPPRPGYRKNELSADRFVRPATWEVPDKQKIFVVTLKYKYLFSFFLELRGPPPPLKRPSEHSYIFFSHNEL